MPIKLKAYADARDALNAFENWIKQGRPNGPVFSLNDLHGYDGSTYAVLRQAVDELTPNILEAAREILTEHMLAAARDAAADAETILELVTVVR